MIIVAFGPNTECGPKQKDAYSFKHFLNKLRGSTLWFSQTIFERERAKERLISMLW